MQGCAAKDDYVFESRLAQGSCASIFRGRHMPSNTRVAIKRIRVSTRSIRNARMEWEVACALRSHANIVEYVDFFVDRQYIYIVQELFECGDLLDFVEAHGAIQNEHFLKSVASQVADALDYMHSKKALAHRDVKPDNIMLRFDCGCESLACSPRAKLGDFGLSDWMGAENDPRVYGFVGSDGFTAPELIAQRGASVVTVDGRAADIFSFGCTLYAVFTGELPFHEASEDTSEEYRSFVARVRAGVVGAVFPHGYESAGASRYFATLLDHMLNPDPTQRISAAGVRQYLSKPWLAGALDSAPGGITESAIHLKQATANLDGAASSRGMERTPSGRKGANVLFFISMDDAAQSDKESNGNGPGFSSDQPIQVNMIGADLVCAADSAPGKMKRPRRLSLHNDLDKLGSSGAWQRCASGHDFTSSRPRAGSFDGCGTAMIRLSSLNDLVQSASCQSLATLARSLEA